MNTITLKCDNGNNSAVLPVKENCFTNQESWCTHGINLTQFTQFMIIFSPFPRFFYIFTSHYHFSSPPLSLSDSNPPQKYFAKYIPCRKENKSMPGIGWAVGKDDGAVARALPHLTQIFTTVWMMNELIMYRNQLSGLQQTTSHFVCFFVFLDLL